MNNKGETLIELIVSLALLALMVTMLATAFQASTSSFYTNIETKRDLNEQVYQLNKEENVTAEKQLTIQYEYEVEGTVMEDVFSVEMVKPSEGSLYKYRLVDVP